MLLCQRSPQHQCSCYLAPNPSHPFAFLLAWTLATARVWLVYFAMTWLVCHVTCSPEPVPAYSQARKAKCEVETRSQKMLNAGSIEPQPLFRRLNGAPVVECKGMTGTYAPTQVSLPPPSPPHAAASRRWIISTLSTGSPYITDMYPHNAAWRCQLTFAVLLRGFSVIFIGISVRVGRTPLP